MGANLGGRLITFLRVGMVVLIQYVLRVRPAGLIAAGIPCNGHVWLSSSGTGKSKDCPHGHNQSDVCKLANLIACRAAAVLMIAITRGVYFTIEQPGSSVMIWLSYMQHILMKSVGKSVRLMLVCSYYMPTPPNNTRACKAFLPN